MKTASRAAATIAAGLAVIGGSLVLAPGAANADASSIACQINSSGSRIDATCVNGSGDPSTVSVHVVCTKLLDLQQRKFVIDDPRVPIGGHATVHITKDCGQGQMATTADISGSTGF